MNNYELTPQGLKTSDPVIAAMFLGAHGVYIGKEECTLESIDDYGWLRGFYNDQANTIKVSAQEIIIPKPLVRETIKHRDGEVAISMAPLYASGLGFRFTAYPRNNPGFEYYNWRVVNICQTYRQLRELTRWVEEE